MLRGLGRSRGFGLVEILVTIGVLAVGIMGVATFHTVVTKQSQDNKLHSEALGIAQSRLEEMRNYTDSASTLAQFNALYPDTAGYANAASVTGVSTTFSRTESIATSGERKIIGVRVSWTDAEGDAQSVQLSTQLGFVSPRSFGDVANSASDPLIDAPTGRARLGEGTLPEGATTTSNGDGTSLYQDGGEDLMLVFDEQIVLTLAQACQTEDGTCIDFVKIKGRIYIDKGSQNQLKPGQVYVVASDAAFCARYYTASGVTHTITRDTLSTVSTANGNYEYFDYTCYLGGGWHGNVGILLAGGLSQSDKICIGDPVSINAWEAPIIASRRAYRGMLYKYDASNASGKEEMSDGEGGTMIKYYSQGIADSTVLPVPDTTQVSHDFVVGSMPVSVTDGASCETQGIMTRTDSNVNGELGDRFAGMPTDFVCLNAGYLDNYDTDLFGHSTTCPYDPSDPPATSHVMSGSIAVTAPDTDVNDALVGGITALTSDGPGNCLVGTFVYSGSNYLANYECDVFDWGNGWNGYLEVVYDASSMACTPNRLYFNDITGDNGGNDFGSCSPGDFAVISGTVTSPNPSNTYLTSATLSDGGACTLGVDGLSYSCLTLEFPDVTWTGTITFGISRGVLCAAPSNVLSFNAVSPGYITRNLTMANNSNNCP